MDADWRCCGRHYFWRSERSLWPRPRSDLDNCAICYLYRIMRFCHRLLGPTDLPHHCRDRPWWRVRHRDGAGCRSMASTSPLTRFVICCVRLAGRRPACRRAYADAPAVYRLARHVHCGCNSGIDCLVYPPPSA